METTAPEIPRAMSLYTFLYLKGGPNIGVSCMIVNLFKVLYILPKATSRDVPASWQHFIYFVIGLKLIAKVLQIFYKNIILGIFNLFTGYLLKLLLCTHFYVYKLLEITLSLSLCSQFCIPWGASQEKI